MFEVVYMKAEYEPWWMFSGWEETILSRQVFENIHEAEVYLDEMLDMLKRKHTHACSKEDCFYAYWSDDEKNFCEACDEDLQIYHGVLLLKEGEPFRKNKTI